VSKDTDARSRSGVPAGKVLLAGLLGLGLAGLLNADALVRDAQAKELGSVGRSVSLALWRPVQDMSDLLRLDRPRAWADEALGRDVDDEQFELPADTAAQPGQASPGEAAAAPGGTATAQEGTAAPATGAAAQPGQAGTGAPGAGPLEARTPTAADPLRVWLGGDSMSQVFGESMMRIATSFSAVDATMEARISTGLTRPDYFDWPGRLDEVVSDEDPEVMVLMFGANDAQGIQAEDGAFQFGEQGWREEYRRRVAGTMDLALADPERLLVWIGQPSASDGGFASRMQEINTIVAEEAARRERVIFVDTWALLNDASGGYSAVLPDDAGQLVEMRQGDGFHLSRAGGDRVALAVMQEIGRHFDLSGQG
jgi:uncharacterized protein